MGDAVIGVLLFVIVFAVAFAIVRSRTRLGAPWRVAEHTRPDGTLVVCCERPGERSWSIGQLTPATPDRGLRLAELRSQAREACAELNARN